MSTSVDSYIEVARATTQPCCGTPAPLPTPMIVRASAFCVSDSEAYVVPGAPPLDPPPVPSSVVQEAGPTTPSLPRPAERSAP
ncbi:hypothetical protein [Nocardioides litoris]|uniref:hypothetical protein n=1 Tax=Nocardioides litoris TaxID=1926648 RepID=UPI0011238C89|nr:hypothetical protein [Nocardioides litoris]